MTKPSEGERQQIEEQQNKQKAISEKDLVISGILMCDEFVQQNVYSSFLCVGSVSVCNIKIFLE